MNLRSLPRLLVVLLVALPGPLLAQAGDEAKATAVVKSYFDRLKAGKVSEGVTELWDVDSFMAGGFGLTYLGLPASERQAAQRSFAGFVAAPYANPKLTAFFATIAVKETRTVRVSDSLVSVALHLTGNEGRFSATNTLLVARSGTAWRIVDQRQNAEPSMRTAIVLMWSQERRGSQDSISVILDRATAEIRRQAERK